MSRIHAADRTSTHPTMHFHSLPLALTLLATPLLAQTSLRRPGPPATPGRLLVSGFNSSAIHVYRTSDGKPGRTLGPIPAAQSITRGPDGDLYVCAEGSDMILRLDGTTLVTRGAFVFDDPQTPEDEAGGLDNPTGALFGPDGNLYVASFQTNAILRYDGQTGAFLDVFVPSGSGGLNGPDAGCAFGPDGNLYVPSFWNNSILRYDGSTGAFLGEFVPPLLGTLRQPRGIVFHNGMAYVASSLNSRILRYDLDGNFVDIFTDSNTPYSLFFHPHDGNLYVVSLQRNNVRVYDGRTGEFVRRAVANGENGLSGATYAFPID